MRHTQTHPPHAGMATKSHGMCVMAPVCVRVCVCFVHWSHPTYGGGRSVRACERHLHCSSMVKATKGLRSGRCVMKMFSIEMDTYTHRTTHNACTHHRHHRDHRTHTHAITARIHSGSPAAAGCVVTSTCAGMRSERAISRSQTLQNGLTLCRSGGLRVCVCVFRLYAPARNHSYAHTPQPVMNAADAEMFDTVVP